MQDLNFLERLKNF